MADRQNQDGAFGDVAGDAAELGREARARLADVAAPLQDKTRTMAEEQKAAGADRLAGLGRAVHDAATDLERELPQAARFIHTAADNLESASSHLRDRSVEDLVGLLNGFARRQPAAAFAGAVLAGFALTRFLKSSAGLRREPM